MLEVLEERRFPAAEVVLLASARSAGTAVPFRGTALTVGEATAEAFAGVDLVLASAGAAASRALLPAAAARGAVCIDNSSAFRMEPDVPLVVPEVNPHRIADHRARNLIANPNCSTIQLVVALKPLADAAGLRRVRVATYQSVSGAGQQAVEELRRATALTLAGGDPPPQVFPRPMAFNVVPQVDVFVDGGETREEWKMRVETVKILEREVAVSATCVRVPVLVGHSEAVWIETEEPLSPEAAAEVLAAAPGVRVMADPAAYPTARDVAGKDPVLVGRIRRDPGAENGLALWVVGDNLRKGAATNAVQIAEGLVTQWRREGRPAAAPVFGRSS
jgi:aspartate-semialdehyde dehydrogenase